MMELLQEVHGFCASILEWASACPEATIAAWFTSFLITVTTVTRMVMRTIRGSNQNLAQTRTVERVVSVPYVPNDTVLKIIRLLNDQEEGWTIETSPAGHSPILRFGSMALRNQWGHIACDHKGVGVHVTKGSIAPDMDQTLLREAYSKRLRFEQNKQKAKLDVALSEAQKRANEELTQMLAQTDASKQPQQFAATWSTVQF
jgi:hypothetical protein